jgi:hypothetical protein
MMARSIAKSPGGSLGRGSAGDCWGRISDVFSARPGS